jgi:hexosaminidase
VEYMAFPRLAALAEVAWTPADQRSYFDFIERLRVHLKRLEILDVNYRPVDP